MRLFGRFVSLIVFVFFLPVSYAGWYVDQGGQAQAPFFQDGIKGGADSPSIAFPNQFSNLGQPNPAYEASIQGSLKDNVTRILSHYHWQVRWLVDQDYRLHAHFSAVSLPKLIGQMMDPFPLQATFYKGNRIVTIKSRTLA
jgi:hypothetical protein